MIIADDLTGSLDAGVCFSSRNMKTFVMITVDFPTPKFNYTNDLEVLVVNTNSRHIHYTEAGNRIKNIVERGKQLKFDAFFKKTDSTLRGNIGAELEMLLHETGVKVLPYIPGHPKMGRTTVNGIHYVHDVPLHETRYAEDPLDPTIDSHVDQILKKQTQSRLFVISNDDYDIRHISGNEEGILIFDCTNETDIRKIGQNLKSNNYLNVTAGTAGFAEILAELMRPQARIKRIPEVNMPVLIVNGSLNKVSMEQVERADTGTFVKLTLGTEQLTSGINSSFRKEIIKICVKSVKNGRSVILRSASSRQDVDDYLIRKYPREIPPKVYEQTAGVLGRLVADLLREGRFRSCMIIGGDTLLAVMNALEIPGIYPIEEIAKGVVHSQIDIQGRPLQLLSKPGGYGENDLMGRLFEKIKSQES